MSSLLSEIRFVLAPFLLLPFLYLSLVFFFFFLFFCHSTTPCKFERLLTECINTGNSDPARVTRASMGSDNQSVDAESTGEYRSDVAISSDELAA